DPPDQGHSAPRRHAGRGRGAGGAAGRRAEVPGGEPDDRRPDAQRPEPRLRAGHRRPPDPGGGRGLPVPAPARLAGGPPASGRLRPDVSPLGALRSLCPPGSMTGAPKLRTMEVIESVESSPRGVYSGAFGWIRPDGRADLAVVIRSLTTGGDDSWTLGTGGGVTVRSEPDDELEESYAKARALLAALRSP